MWEQQLQHQGGAGSSSSRGGRAGRAGGGLLLPATLLLGCAAHLSFTLVVFGVGRGKILGALRRAVRVGRSAGAVGHWLMGGYVVTLLARLAVA